MNTVTITLQPGGEFLIKLENEQYVKGRFRTYALNRFCEQKGIKSYLELWEKITLGMSLQDYAELILCGLQDYYREDVKQCIWTAEKIMDEIIDPVGGMAGPQFLNLVKHAVGRVAPIPESDEDNAGEPDEKKNT